jgi:hypothetical protein
MRVSSVITGLSRAKRDKALDADVVTVLQNRFDAINSVRMTAQADSLEKYQDLVHAGQI